MCCFTVLTPLSLVGRLFAKRVHVSHTNVFARMVRPGVQAGSSFQLPGTSYAGLVDETRPLVRRILRGTLPNDDTWVS